MSTSLTVWKVYLLVFPNSKVYVGVTKYSVRVRLLQHFHAAASGSRLSVHSAMRRYGTNNVVLKLLGRYASDVEAKQAEVQWIAQYRSYGDGGYNRTIGGNGVLDPNGKGEAIRVVKMKSTMATPEYKRLQQAIQRRVWTEEKRRLQSVVIQAQWKEGRYDHRPFNNPMWAFGSFGESSHQFFLSVMGDRRRRRQQGKFAPDLRSRLSAIQIKVQNTSEMKAAKSRATKLQMSDPHQRVQIAEKMSKWHGLVFRKVKDINPFRWDNNCYSSWTSLPTSVTTYDLIATGWEARHFTLALAKGAIEVCN